MADYRKLHVWQKADGLATAIYEIANAVRKSGHRDLAEQLKRSANSIVSNIAEGSGHTSRKDFSRFLQYSNASCCELESQVSIARNVGAIPHQRSEKVFDDIAVIRKMLAGLTKKLKA